MLTVKKCVTACSGAHEMRALLWGALAWASDGRGPGVSAASVRLRDFRSGCSYGYSKGN